MSKGKILVWSGAQLFTKYLLVWKRITSYGCWRIRSKVIVEDLIYILKKESFNRICPALCCDYRATTKVPWEEIWINCCWPGKKKRKKELSYNLITYYRQSSLNWKYIYTYIKITLSFDVARADCMSRRFFKIMRRKSPCSKVTRVNFSK